MSVPEWIARFQSLLAKAAYLQTSALHVAEALPGFQFDETMSGTVSFTGAGLPGGQRRVVLHLRARSQHLSDYLRDGRTVLSGTVSIEGMVESAELQGSLWIWPHRRVIRYELSFPMASRTMHFSGQKNVRLLDFKYTMSTLPAKLHDEDGHEIGQATVVFAWSDLPTFLRSFRPSSSPHETATSSAAHA